jgi:hypothetical protein
MPKHVGIEYGTYQLKIHYFLERLLVFLQAIQQDARFNHKERYM